jgi:hypothetical protein
VGGPTSGSMAERPFSDADECAIAALDEINPLSIKKNGEFAGRIYRKSDGFFYFTRPIKGKRDTSAPPPFIHGAANVGVYHTHSGNFDEADESFSSQDMLKANMAREYSWLETPHQRILRFTPLSWCTDGVFDAKISGRIEVLRNTYVLREITITAGDPDP